MKKLFILLALCTLSGCAGIKKDVETHSIFALYQLDINKYNEQRFSGKISQEEYDGLIKSRKVVFQTQLLNQN